MFDVKYSAVFAILEVYRQYKSLLFHFTIPPIPDVDQMLSNYLTCESLVT